ncbi:MAG: hypothetical protein ACM3YN_00655 [Parcubacteria group bacterium]
MAKQDPIARFIPPLFVPLLVALAMYYVVMFTPRVLYDGDTFWQLGAGLKMLELHTIFKTDPFSYTMPGAPWHTHEWLSEIFFALAYKVGGWSAVVMLGGLTTGLAAFIMGRWIARYLPPLSTIAMLALAFYAMSPSTLVRPHLLALPILAFWTVSLLKAREANRAPSLWLLPLMTLWANMHGGYIFGLALIGPFALEALVTAPREKWLDVVWRWGLFGVLALGAALITPHGVYGLIFPFKVASMKSLKDIVEWKAADFSKPTPLEEAFMAVLLVSFVRGVRVPWVRALVVLGLLAMALQHIRHVIVLAVVAPLILAKPFGEALEPEHEPHFERFAKQTLTVALAAFIGLTASRFVFPLVRKDDVHSPVTAFNSVPADLRTHRVFNSYALGGYLIYKGIPVFIDGRADMYGDDFTAQYLKIARSTDPAMVAQAQKKWGFDWAIIEADTAVIKAFEKAPGWKKTYSDKVATVFVREGYDRSTSLPPSTAR